MSKEGGWRRDCNNWALRMQRLCDPVFAYFSSFASPNSLVMQGLLFSCYQWGYGVQGGWTWCKIVNLIFVLLRTFWKGLLIVQILAKQYFEQNLETTSKLFDKILTARKIYKTDNSRWSYISSTEDRPGWEAKRECDERNHGRSALGDIQRLS